MNIGTITGKRVEVVYDIECPYCHEDGNEWYESDKHLYCDHPPISMLCWNCGQEFEVNV
jgi:hypothetical protein